MTGAEGIATPSEHSLDVNWMCFCLGEGYLEFFCVVSCNPEGNAQKGGDQGTSTVHLLLAQAHSGLTLEFRPGNVKSRRVVSKSAYGHCRVRYMSSACRAGSSQSGHVGSVWGGHVSRSWMHGVYGMVPMADLGSLQSLIETSPMVYPPRIPQIPCPVPISSTHSGMSCVSYLR